MIERPPEPQTPEEWKRESHKEKIRERLIWIKGEDIHDITAMLDTVIQEVFKEPVNFDEILERIIDDEAFASAIAEMLDVETRLLRTDEFVAREKFLGED